MLQEAWWRETGGNQDMLEHVSYCIVLFFCWTHSIQKLFMKYFTDGCALYPKCKLPDGLTSGLVCSANQKRVVAFKAAAICSRPKMGDDHQRHLYQYNLRMVFIFLLLTSHGVLVETFQNVWVSDFLYHNRNGNLLPDCMHWYWETQSRLRTEE